VTNSAVGAPEITLVPFVVIESDSENHQIEFHIAKDNFQSQRFEANTICGLLVSGAHGYISSSVYEKENVPTYNYESVYLTCKSSVMTLSELENHLDELVNHFERNRSLPLKYKNFNNEMISEYLEEIVGIRLQIIKMEGAFKLSQNRSPKDMVSIVNDNSSNPVLCQAMLKHYKND